MKKNFWLINGLALLLVSGCSNHFFPPKPEAVLESLHLNSLPAKIFYIIGEDLDHEGLEVIGIYSDNREKIEPIDQKNLIGYDSEKPGPQLITVLVEDQTVVFMVTVCELQYIELITPPEKIDYAIGDTIDTTGLVVTGYYSYEENLPLSRNELISPDNLSGYAMGTPGKQTVTVTVKDKTVTFVIKIYPLDYIAVTDPGREHYLRGEVLELSAMEVTGYYANRDGEDPAEPIIRIETLEPYMISNYDPETLGSQTVTVTIEEKTDNFDVMVWEFIDLQITAPPLKTIYAKGEELDIKGLAVTGSYNNGTVTKTYPEPITMDNISGYDAYSQVTQVITVTVRDRQTSFEVSMGGQMNISINLDDSPGGLEENIILSKTGTLHPKETTLSLSKEYAEYAWFINDSDSSASAEKTFVLKAEGLPFDNNRLRVEVKTDTGIFYGRELIFTIKE
ncbi:bacterial Ig-like domain-containing protein [Treponema primitia]|uniref:bacterial Ig-like domain-containing protein n=1 Tax=Treponema primitia TaxID=88058 RepID=UPI00397F19EE